MRKPCCHFHKTWLSLCPPHPRLPHPTSPSWSLLKGRKKRKPWWFHSNYTIIKWQDFVTEARAKLRESNWLKLMTFFQSAYSQIESVNKNLFCYFFPPPRVLCIMQREPGLVFSKPFFFVSPALFIPILFPLTSLLRWMGFRCVGFAQASFVLSSACFWE